jgi:hypothetical protein
VKAPGRDTRQEEPALLFASFSFLAGYHQRLTVIFFLLHASMQRSREVERLRQFLLRIDGTGIAETPNPARNGRIRPRQPVSSGILAGTGCSFVCSGLGGGTSYTGRNGWYRSCSSLSLDEVHLFLILLFKHDKNQKIFFLNTAKANTLLSVSLARFLFL